MKLSPLFKISEEATPELIALLESATLGTNGAKYRHLNTRESIQDVDSPLHLSMERNGKIIGNITFCKRKDIWYIRYFAFSESLQGGGKVKSRGGEGFLKRELEHFFSELLSGKSEFGPVQELYAYIDPNNEKSLWMSENFGFKQVSSVVTQTFSRIRLKKKTRVERTDWETVAPFIRNRFSDQRYYFETHLCKGPFFAIRNHNGEIVACTKISHASWEIKRLPGKMGGFLTKLIPYLPFIRRIIHPKKHSFLVPEATYVNNNDAEILVELYEGVLALEQKHLMLWWVDEKDALYTNVSHNLNWGLLHKIVGINYAAVVVRSSNDKTHQNSNPIYTCGFDFV